MKSKSIIWLGIATLALLPCCTAPSINHFDCIENITMEQARQFSWIDQQPTKSMEQAQAIKMDNEFERNQKGQNANFYCNPLLINGKPLNYAKFSIASTGVLTVAEGDPLSPQATKIPFRVFLRRKGIILNWEKDAPANYEIEIGDILKHAQPDDQLIIAPARKTDWKAKRILKIIEPIGC